MANPNSMPDIAKLRFSDADDEDLFASPEPNTSTQKHATQPTASSAPTLQPSRPQSKEDAASARDAHLRTELAKIREVNAVIESVTASLSKAKANMSTVHRTVDNASTLLATWTRILSQTEYNQRLILNPNWQGASRDMEDLENEELRRQQEGERRAAEDLRRREETARKAEEEARRREAESKAKSGRGLGRTRSVRGSGYGVSGTARTGQTARGRGTAGAGTRGDAGVGRGVAGTRGRGRGVG